MSSVVVDGVVIGSGATAFDTTVGSGGTLANSDLSITQNFTSTTILTGGTAEFGRGIYTDTIANSGATATITVGATAIASAGTNAGLTN